MTIDEKRVAIAREEGWEITYGDCLCDTINKTASGPAYLPDYFGSRDVMISAILRRSQLEQFAIAQNLRKMMGVWSGSAAIPEFASAAQLAEAFGLALGLWK